MRSLRVWMLLHHFYPVVGGAEVQAQRLGRALLDWGVEVRVITPCYREDWPRREVVDGVEVERVEFSFPVEFFGGVAPLFRFLVRHRARYDILHVHQLFGHGLVSAVVGYYFRRVCLLKVACSGRYGDLWEASRQRGFSLALRVLRRVDGVVAISERIRRELEGYGFPSSRIYSLPNGVDVERFSPLEGDRVCRRRRIFLFVGRRVPQKGVDILLEAVRILRQVNGVELPPFEVHLYGEDYPEYDYRGLARRKGVGDVVRFFPVERDMVSLYRRAFCFVLPSRGEGLSNALLEAMATGLPVIVSEASSEVVRDGENGILVPVGDAEALAAGMRLLLERPEYGWSLGDRARRDVVAYYSLREVARRYIQLYWRCYESLGGG